MERKRKLPARAARVESASKKRTSTPPEPRTQTPTPSLPPPVVEEVLPTSIAPGKPLPTVDEPQPSNLPAKDFQTIPESGVLLESLHRSRVKWLSEGIFEKYWTKPTKRKGAPDAPPDNPPKESMTKLGSCTITVEPHHFDATMYAIKDPNPRQPLPAPQQNMCRPIIQYGPPGGMMPPPAPTPPPVQQKPEPTPQPTPQPSPKSQDVHMTGTSPTIPPNNGATNGGGVTNSHTKTATPQQAPAKAPPAQPSQPTTKSTDPVIQMLAERAATDPNLKALMRIVANGEATPTELKTFQGHIDELTRLQKAREAAAPPPQPIAQIPAPSPSTSTAQPLQPNGSVRPIQTSAPPPTQIKPNPGPPPPQTPTPQPQALRSKGPLPTKPDITGVVFEFTIGNGDRYKFPTHSILEYLPGGQVIASFLIVRKGSKSDSPTYDPDLDYYQPITIRLFAHQGRQLEALQKIVAPPDEVRRYMDEIMDNATRAEFVLLAMRLPRETEQAQAEKENVANKPVSLENQITPWATTTSTPIAKVNAMKGPPTEQEMYQKFITTVVEKV